MGSGIAWLSAAAGYSTIIYDLKPEMSAYEITEKITDALKGKEVDFVCLNFANPDMVGHTGVFEAAVKACETVDTCARDVAEAALKSGYATVIIADHGNADMMINDDGTPNTAHTTNMVPCILVDATYPLISSESDSTQRRKELHGKAQRRKQQGFPSFASFRFFFAPLR